MGFMSRIKGLVGKKAEDEEDGSFLSLVFLLKEPRTLDLQALNELANEAVGVPLTVQEAPAGFHGEGSQVFLAAADNFKYAFQILSVNRPYFDDPKETAEDMPDLRMKQAVLEHGGWLSVDLPGNADAWEDKDEAYRQIGKLLAALAWEDCLAIVNAEVGAINVFRPEMVETLRGPDPLDVFGQFEVSPIVNVADDDPEMVAAVAEARRRWPEFVAAFEKRTEDQVFGVKVPFREGGEEEFMWVTVTRIDGDEVTGILDSDSIYIKNIKTGDDVHVGIAELNDWNYVKDGELIGGFTIKVLQARMKQGQGAPEAARAAEPPKPKPEEKRITLLFLLTQARILDPQALGELATETFGEPFQFQENPAPKQVVGKGGQVFGGFCAPPESSRGFYVTSGTLPYWDNPKEIAESIPDPVCRNAILQHRAFLTVDLADAATCQDDAEAFRQVARLLAALAWDDCMAVVLPGQAMTAYRPELNELLTGPRPLDVFEGK